MKNKEIFKNLKRTHYCGELQVSHQNSVVVLMGWVKKIRNHGELLFLDIRDKTGFVQVVLNPKQKEFADVSSYSLESVIAIQGNVCLRPEGMVSSHNPTGKIEVMASCCELISRANTPPFVINSKNISENLGLKYRYLDLRSQKLQKNIQLAHDVYQVIRKQLIQLNFTEVNTPILYKTTPEGARDYLVPSRQYPGSFYALVQSPQILKQLLMISGVDRYFQMARCFRDEDLRSDRQPEFTQLDMELSFVDAQDVIKINTNLVKILWQTFKNQTITNIPSMSYEQAMEIYGTDSPDLRNPLKLKDISLVVKNIEFELFNQVLNKKGVIKSLTLPNQENFNNSRIKKLTTDAKNHGLGGLLWIKSLADGSLKSSAQKVIQQSDLQNIFDHAEGKKNGIVFILAGFISEISPAADFLITLLGKQENLISTKQDKFIWITEFPLFEYDSNHQRWKSCHHPFTAPLDEDLNLLLEQNINSKVIRSKSYDLVCNGQEIAGGSVRIHEEKTQKAVFKALSLSEQECKQKFGFFLEALGYGTPPHGGIAWGVDRLLMLLSNTDNIKDVIAFPKTTSGMCLMSSAPSAPDKSQLLDLGIQLITKELESGK